MFNILTVDPATIEADNLTTAWVQADKGIIMQNYSTDALLLAVPELKDVAPKHYPELILLAAQATFKTRKPFWREFMTGLTIFAAIYLSNRIATPDSIWISCILTGAIAVASMFAIDLVYFRKLKPAIIDRLAKIKVGKKD